MKLLSVMTRHPVRRPGDLTPGTHYKASEYEISYDAGIVTITSPKGSVLVPLSNVQDMVPVASPKK